MVRMLGFSVLIFLKPASMSNWAWSIGLPVSMAAGDHEVRQAIGILQGRDDQAALEFGIVHIGPGRETCGKRLGVVGNALPGLQVVCPHAVHVHGAGPQLREVGNGGGRQLLEQVFLDGENHDGIVHHDDAEILLILGSSASSRDSPASGCPRRRSWSCIWLRRPARPCVHPRREVGGAAHHDLLGLRRTMAGKPPTAAAAAAPVPRIRRRDTVMRSMAMASLSPLLHHFPRRGGAIVVPIVLRVGAAMPDPPFELMGKDGHRASTST